MTPTPGTAGRGVAARRFLWLDGPSALGLVRLLVIARLLSPDDFGRFAIAATTLGLLERLADLTTPVRVPVAEGTAARDRDAAWTLAVARAAVLALALVGGADSIAAWFREPRATGVLRALALVPLVRVAGAAAPRGPAAVPLLEAATETALVIALVPFVGVWALVAAAVGAALAGVVVSYGGASASAAPRHRPRLIRDRAALEQGLRFAGPLAGAAALLATADFVVRLAVSRRLGAGAVGVFALVAGIAALPAGAAAATLREVAVPRFARLTAEALALRRAFRATLTELAVALVPLFAALAAAADGIGGFALGANWVDAGWTLRVLAVAGAVGVLALGAAPLFEGVAARRLVAVTAAAQLAPVVILAAPLTGVLGLRGAALAWLGGAAVTLVVDRALVRRLLGPSPGHAHRVAAIVGAGAVAWVVTLMVPVMLGGVAGVVVGIASGALLGVKTVRWADEAWKLGIADDLRVVGMLRAGSKQQPTPPGP